MLLLLPRPTAAAIILNDTRPAPRRAPRPRRADVPR
jgi:hypothetical protein